MADSTYDAAIEELEKAIKELAQSATGQAAGYALNYAAAANQLAEARAWLIRPDQAHGGGSPTSS